MHKLSERSVFFILKNGGFRCRSAAAAAPVSYSNHLTEEVDTKPRWYSVLTAGASSGIVFSKQINPQNELFTGYRYESTAAATESFDPPSEKYDYQAEVSRSMDLIVNSLYSNKEVFLRELISNASDALDKLRFLSVADNELMKDAPNLDIRIQADGNNGIITITDSGIGMTREELVDFLGTIPQSGTSKFLDALKEGKDVEADSNLIGQFGVGFYSAFLVSDRVVVSTKNPKSDKQYVWEGEANSSFFTIREETDPEKLIPRGTRLTLHLKRDAKAFAHPERIQMLVKSYSQFISFPIYTWQEKGYSKEVEVDEDPAEGKKDEQQDVNSQEEKKKTKMVVVLVEKCWDWELIDETYPIWLRNPKEVTTEDYNAFYKKTFNEYLEPLASSHFTTEEGVKFRSILYVSSIAPMEREDMLDHQTKNIRLYVKRVFISDSFGVELFPRYMSFVKGVIDLNDHPLNVSRETLQDRHIVYIMRRRLVQKTFEMLKHFSDSEMREEYKKFWKRFGKYIKLGCIMDHPNHKHLGPLLRFFSSQSEEEMISLDEYVQNMKAEQKSIYYVGADSLTSAKNAPFLEKLLEKGLQVLFLVDPIDEIAVTNLKRYNGIDFVDVSREYLDLGEKNEDKEKEIEQEYGQTCDWIKKRLGVKVARVKISNRLNTSPCVVVSGFFGWSPNLERLLKTQSTDYMTARKVFEINPDHPIVRALDNACRNSPNDEEALRAIDLLYDAALVSSGLTPENLAQFSEKVCAMMGMALCGKWYGPNNSGYRHDVASADKTCAKTEHSEVIKPC